MLKKSELYHLIYKIIQKSKQERKENKENKSENVKNYYHDFLKKRKLIPKSHNCKIKDIMKFFQQLDSYVDLNDIVVAIHEHINNENNQLEIQELKNIQSQKKLKKTLTQPMQSVTSRHERTMEKAERLIRDSYKDGHYLQLNRCSQIVQNLQKGSHQLNNVKYKNNATMPTYHQLINKRYSEGRKYYVPNTALKSRKNSFNDEYEIQSQSLNSAIHYEDKESPWKMLQERQRNFKILQKFLENDDVSEMPAGLFQLTALNPNVTDSQNRKKHFDESKMLHSAAVYLHMILEREHYKKWTFPKHQLDEKGKLNFKNMMKSSENEQSEECGNKLKFHDMSNYSEIDAKQKQNRYQVQTTKNFDEFAMQVPLRQKTCVQLPLKVQFDQQGNMSRFVKKSNTSKGGRGLLKSCRNLKQSNNKKYVTILIKTEPNINIKQKPASSKQKQVKRPSICRPNNETIYESEQIHELSERKQFPRKIKQKPRHTFGNPQQLREVNARRSAEKEFLEQKHQENRQLRDKFTFKKRKVKEGVLRKINQFVSDVEHVERTMIIDSKNCEKELNRIRDKMQFQFQTYHTQKFLADDKALQGVRCALSKQSTGMKRFQSLLKK